jgi:uncharacterized membrane protein
MYPRHRLDGLTDGIFAVAMTLLVLDIRIPEGADPRTDRELVALLAGLAPKIWPYALSFAVLAGRWRVLIAGRTSHLAVGRRYVTWTLINLFLVTLVPFSTLVLGRYASLSPAIWLYTANLAGMAIAAWRVSRAAPHAEREEVGDGRVGLVIFLISAAIVLALSVRHTPYAMLGFLLTAFSPVAEWLFARRRARAAS